METITIQGNYVNPSESCIRVVKKSDMACICRVITLEDEMTISVVKTIRLARQCHMPLEIGSKCGNKYLKVTNLIFSRKLWFYIDVDNYTL